jgi:hypothetical protein
MGSSPLPEPIARWCACPIALYPGRLGARHQGLCLESVRPIRRGRPRQHHRHQDFLMISQERLPRPTAAVHRLHGSRDPRSRVRCPASLQSARPGRRPGSPARAVRHAEQEVQWLRRRALQHSGADLLWALRGAGALGAGRQSAAGWAGQGHRRRHARATGKRPTHLESRAAVLRG